MPNPTALFALSLMQCQRRLRISRVKNSDNVFDLRVVSFRLAPFYGGLLVEFFLANSLLFTRGKDDEPFTVLAPTRPL